MYDLVMDDLLTEDLVTDDHVTHDVEKNALVLFRSIPTSSSISSFCRAEPFVSSRSMPSFRSGVFLRRVVPLRRVVSHRFVEQNAFVTLPSLSNAQLMGRVDFSFKNEGKASKLTSNLTGNKLVMFFRIKCITSRRFRWDLAVTYDSKLKHTETSQYR